jgi:hypothetical protein
VGCKPAGCEDGEVVNEAVVILVRRPPEGVVVVPAHGAVGLAPAQAAGMGLSFQWTWLVIDAGVDGQDGVAELPRSEVRRVCVMGGGKAKAPPVAADGF